VTWLVGLVLRLAGIRWERGHWLQDDTEVIPEYLVLGILLFFLIGGIWLIMALAYWVLTLIATARA
jgi:hypothetical protein